MDEIKKQKQRDNLAKARAAKAAKRQQRLEQASKNEEQKIKAEEIKKKENIESRVEHSVPTRITSRARKI